MSVHHIIEHSLLLSSILINDKLTEMKFYKKNIYYINWLIRASFFGIVVYDNVDRSNTY